MLLLRAHANGDANYIVQRPSRNGGGIPCQRRDHELQSLRSEGRLSKSHVQSNAPTALKTNQKMAKSVYSFILIFIVLAQASSAPSNVSPLTEQLHNVLFEPNLPPSREKTSLMQALSTYWGTIDQIYSGSKQGYRNSSAGASEVCQIGQLLFDFSKALNASSLGYVNATEVNWSVMQKLKRLAELRQI